jgi:hypothetical protein
VGAGYTPEDQVSGKEKFGGIQIEVIPSYEQYTHAFRYSTEGRVKYAAEYDTPGDYALKDGDRVTMAPKSFRYKCRVFTSGQMKVQRPGSPIYLHQNPHMILKFSIARMWAQCQLNLAAPYSNGWARAGDPSRNFKTICGA